MYLFEIKKSVPSLILRIGSCTFCTLLYKSNESIAIRNMYVTLFKT